jgi:hypothetical protein
MLLFFIYARQFRCCRGLLEYSVVRFLRVICLRTWTALQPVKLNTSTISELFSNSFIWNIWKLQEQFIHLSPWTILFHATVLKYIEISISVIISTQTAAAKISMNLCIFCKPCQGKSVFLSADLSLLSWGTISNVLEEWDLLKNSEICSNSTK